MVKISAVIITYNEASNIERCIQSVSKVADEIIVSDSFSVDETKNIAIKNGAIVFSKTFVGYGLTKNEANKLAQHDWILSLDADEEISIELQNTILEIKSNLDNNSVYIFKRLNNYCGQWIKHGGWYPDKKPRLFNKKFVQWNLAVVHETLEIPNNNNQIELDGNLLHYSYATVESHQRKIENYSTKGAEEAFKKNKKASLLKRFGSPIFKFVRDYVFKLGFLDGHYGLVIAFLSAKEVYLKYKKLHQLKLF